MIINFDTIINDKIVTIKSQNLDINLLKNDVVMIDGHYYTVEYKIYNSDENCINLRLIPGLWK